MTGCRPPWPAWHTCRGEQATGHRTLITLVTGYWLLVTCFLTTGCGRKSSLLLERQARGPLTEEQAIAHRVMWILEPSTQTKTQGGVEVSATHASPSFLADFFRNKKVFGEYAGLNPYFAEQIVFYVRIANASAKKIRLNPADFVLIDDKGNQYHSLSADYSTALAESRAPVATMTRGVLEDARPGYFGVGLPVGKILGKPQQRFALLSMANLQPGYLYPGVVYDGLVAFWSPHEDARKLQLLLANIKTDFNAEDLPKATMDFAFEFSASLPQP